MKMKKIKISIISLVIGLWLVLGTSCITINTPTSPEAPGTTPPATTLAPASSPINPAWTPPAASQSLALPNIADAVAVVKPSVVAITTEVVSFDLFNRSFTQKGAGSGWILDKDGIIVTNNHVIEGAKTITVTLDDGRTFTANTKTVSIDSLNDLAIIKIDAQNLPSLKIGSASKLRIGDWVIAVGNALGQGTRATEGIISRNGVSIPLDQGQTLYDLIETSAAINPGNSGGPLVNLSGEVIGITSVKIADVGVEGMGYAISIDTALPIIQELVNRGYVARPFLGVQDLLTVDQSVATYFRLSVNKGVLIRGVVAGAPASQAGLQAGDVIVGIGGKEVANVQELLQALYASKIGQPLEIAYWRGNTQNTTKVTPMASPSPS
jgi:serine protease Do